jgi:hypothetical protein
VEDDEKIRGGKGNWLKSIWKSWCGRNEK